MTYRTDMTNYKTNKTNATYEKNIDWKLENESRHSSGGR